MGHKAILNATEADHAMIRISTLKIYEPNFPEARRQKPLGIECNPLTGAL